MCRLKGIWRINNDSFFFLLLLTIIIIFNPHLRICFYWFFKERERNINRLPPVCTSTRDQTRTPGVCSDWESNPQSWCTGQCSNQLNHSPGDNDSSLKYIFAQTRKRFLLGTNTPDPKTSLIKSMALTSLSHSWPSPQIP